MSTTPNPHLVGLRCIRCARIFDLAPMTAGCPACASEGQPANVAPHYEHLPPLGGLSSGRGLRRFASRLVCPDFPSLGEGDTPLVASEALAREFGLQRSI